MRRRELLLHTPAVFGAAQAMQSPLPNIVVIFADNLGYGDVGCYGSIIRTPNLDRMAKEGVRFTHAYAANPICSPSRAALLTGRYPPRAGVPGLIRPPDRDGLPPSEVTLAQVLKRQGYRTACFGKWHLGHTPGYFPTDRGFDEYLGVPYSIDMTPRPLMRGTEVIEEPARLDKLTSRFTTEALRFISDAGDSPFFLYLPHTAPHPPQAASERFSGRSPAGVYGDVVEEMDWSTGEILAALKKRGISDNTLVIYTSDNGPMNLGSAGPLRGRITSTLEGGMRVPFMAWWPGRIPGGRVSDTVISTLDILPTAAGLCRAPLPKAHLDGMDLWPLFSGSRAELARDVLLYFDNVHIQCARLGRYKLHISRYGGGARRVNLPLRPPELYDVVADPGEAYDIAPEHPAVVAQIRDGVEQIVKAMPKQVQQAYAETNARKTLPRFPGATPREARP